MSNFTLYRMYDADGQLLYVGQSIRLAQRLSEHGKQSAFWDEVATITVERLANAVVLNDAERTAIEAEKPKHNIAMNPLRRRAESVPTAEAPTRRTYTVAETAEKLGLSTRLVYDAIARGEMRHIRAGRRIVIPRWVVDALLNDADEAAS